MPRRPGARVWALVGALTAVVLAALVLRLVFARRESLSPPVPDQEVPFRYPASLYAQRIQGNVTLRIFIDRDGRVWPESTRVEESSGYASFDSAAVTGSQDLRFRPARRRGKPVAVSILFPVFFRHPEASPLPGDTVLKRQ